MVLMYVYDYIKLSYRDRVYTKDKSVIKYNDHNYVPDTHNINVRNLSMK